MLDLNFGTFQLGSATKINKLVLRVKYFPSEEAVGINYKT